MNNEQVNEEREQSKPEESLIQDHLLKLGVPGTLTRLKDIVQELENEKNELELQKDELEKARQDLLLLLDQYTNLYNLAPVGYLTLDKDGVITEINKAGAVLFGIESESLADQNLEQFIPDDLTDEYHTFLKKIFSTQSQEMIDFQLQRRNDTIIVRIIAQKNPDQNSCIATIIDMTTDLSNKPSQRNDHKYQTIFENITHGIILCGKDGTVLSANKAAKNILGLTFNQIKTKPLLEIFSNPIHEDGKVFVGGTLPFIKVLNSAESFKDMTIGYIPKDSTHYNWIVVSAIEVALPDEKDVQFLVSFDDITTQKNLFLYNKLTIREKQVFQMLVKGSGRQEIAKILGISTKTVDKHRENLTEKLNIYLPEDLIDFSRHC